MHGIIHMELKRFVEAYHGQEAWLKVLENAGLGNKVYWALSVYPDDETVAIVKSASELTSTPVQMVLEAFGEFIVPTLVSMYSSHINPDWGMVEMLLHTEEIIHRVVRMRNPGAEPPKLKFEKIGDNELRFLYDSPRKMSALAKGIIRAVAGHYQNKVSIQEKNVLGGNVEMLIKVT